MGVDFQREVRPILSEHCLACHGPDDASRAADLRLDIRALAVASAERPNAPITAGDAAASHLVERITSGNESEVMPPPEFKKPLSAAQIDTLQRWIAEGAKYEVHWAFTAPVRPAVPEVDPSYVVHNEIDRFILARLAKEGLAPSEPAAREALLRRLSLDLVGLPPTVDELDAFAADTSPDAYANAVERLLASPHYGERWARWWLDGARYADSDGYEKDLQREVWMYRDWVIAAFNRNLPYDQFVAQQLAGDLLPEAGQDERVATGFLRNSTINEEGGIDPEQFRIEGNFERMDIIGKSLLGLTINCCQCHSHKYDPVTQREYYQLLAYVNEAEEVTVAVYTPSEQNERERVLREIARRERGLKHSQPDWRRHLEVWARAQRAQAATDWQAVPVTNVANQARRFIYHDDHSVTSWGYNPPNTVSEFAGTVPLPMITAIQLETLTDPLLPCGGPGRAPTGLFALSEMQLEVHREGSEPRAIKIASATADVDAEPQLLPPGYENPAANQHRVIGPVAYAIDGNKATAWGIDIGPGRSNVDRKAVFVLAEPLQLAPGETLKFLMRHDHGGYNPDSRLANNIGRFRLSVTSDPQATVDPLPRSVRECIAAPCSEWTDAQTDAVFAYWRTTVPQWQGVNDQIEALWRQHPAGTTQLAFAAREAQRTTHVLHRGDFLQPGQPVEVGVLTALHPLPADAPPNRLGLARWITDRQAPTTARAIVNRVWQAYFGTGIVDTPDDFGMQGSLPTHPELLDWLAVELMEHNWDLRWLHRTIVHSATYQQSSQVRADLLARDPANRWLARGPRVRVDGEVVRDIALTASGLLTRDVGGPPVFPPTPEFLFQPPNSFGPKAWPESHGPARYRRALYTFRYRSVPNPALTTFDSPPGDVACVRRNRSNTPLQALVLLNEPLFVECAQALATDLLAVDESNDARLDVAFRRCVGRSPTSFERDELLALLDEQLAFYSQPDSEPWQLAAPDPAHPPLLAAHATPAQAAAWTAVSRVLLGLDETITKE